MSGIYMKFRIEDNTDKKKCKNIRNESKINVMIDLCTMSGRHIFYILHIAVISIWTDLENLWGLQVSSLSDLHSYANSRLKHLG